MKPLKTGEWIKDYCATHYQFRKVYERMDGSDRFWIEGALMDMRHDATNYGIKLASEEWRRLQKRADQVEDDVAILGASE